MLNSPLEAHVSNIANKNSLHLWIQIVIETKYKGFNTENV